MNNLPIINNYARSLFIISMGKGALDDDKELLETILYIFEQNQKLYKILLNPVINFAKKLTLLDLIFSKIKPNDHLYSFIKILLKNHRINIYETIVKRFIDLILKNQNIVYAKLTTARSVNDKELSDIKAFMDSKYNCTFKFNTSIEPDLIGGLVLEFDNKILDASIATTIDKLKNLSLRAVNNI